MAPVQNLYRLQFGGKVFADERWSCSLHMNSPDPVNTAAADFVVPLSQWFSSHDAGNSDSTTLDEVKFNKIAKVVLPGGQVRWRYANQVTDVAPLAVPVSGNQNQMPPQCTLSLGLTTALKRGRGHAGRIYPPSGLDDLQNQIADGRVSAPEAMARAQAFRTLLLDLNAPGGGLLMSVVVFSAVAETVEPVTGVRCGRVIDTMRSRRTSLAEDYQNVDL